MTCSYYGPSQYLGALTPNPNPNGYMHSPCRQSAAFSMVPPLREFGSVMCPWPEHNVAKQATVTQRSIWSMCQYAAVCLSGTRKNHVPSLKKMGDLMRSCNSKIFFFKI